MEDKGWLCALSVASLITLFIAAMLLSSCSTVPSCSDNPRNMQCMSVDQLRKELAK